MLTTAFICLAAVAPATAQTCNFSSSNINFGSVSADLQASVQTTGTVTANCTGRRNRTITICPNIASGSGGSNADASLRYITSGGEQIPFNLYHNAGQGQVWGSYVWASAPRPPAMSLTLSGNGSGSATRTIFASMYQANVSAGLYTSSFSGNNTRFTYGYAPGFNCSRTTRRTVQVPFTVQANNLGDCQITATPLDFGTLANLNAQVDATNTISVTCSNRVNYSVSLSNGLSGATSPAARRMTAATGTGTITYGIYTNAGRTNPFGANAFSGNGNGNARTFVGYGRIPAQSTPAPTDYSDTVVVTVTY